MKSKDLLKGLNHIDEKIVEETASKKSDPKIRFLKFFIPVAACFAIAILGIKTMTQNEQFLYSDENITVKAIDIKEIVIMESSLEWLTEEQLFNKYNTDIFKGEVENIENIEIDFGGEVSYNSLVTIKIDEVFRGGAETNDSVTILLPIPLDIDDIWVSDTGTITEIRTGMTGIFMPLVLDDETALWMQNDIWFDKREIADYGILDGERYAFLETDNDIIFATFAYESIQDATTLEEIETYIKTMIE